MSKPFYTPPRIHSIFTSQEAPLRGCFIVRADGRNWVVSSDPQGWQRRRPLIGRHQLTEVKFSPTASALLKLRGVPSSSLD